jgi:hypothetical protein
MSCSARISLLGHAMTPVNKQRLKLRLEGLRPALVLVASLLGIATSLFTALTLVPRVRLVEVVTVFASAVGGGAGLTWATMEFRKARNPAKR